MLNTMLPFEQEADHLLASPAMIKKEFPISYKITQFVHSSRQMIKDILRGQDKRLLVLVGPCSIHDLNATFEYSNRLKALSDKLSDELCIIMRTYFEKPRTTMGWRGIITDPHLNGHYDIDSGLRLARKILMSINEIGIPCGTEFLNILIPPYFADLISWVAIGARTSESQIHRELISGLPIPAGFKNNTDGNIQVAIDAVKVAQYSHSTIGISQAGYPITYKTLGNLDCHIILRGSQVQPNFYAHTVENAASALKMQALHPSLMVDCSHGNTGKNYQLQGNVVHSICEQIKNKAGSIMGVMLESHLIGGQQLLNPPQAMVYGQSITDACLSWEETVPLLEKLAQIVKIHKKVGLR